MHSLVELIMRKRDGEALDRDEVSELIVGLGSGALADYQMTALLMAIYLRGMTDEETLALTEAMLHSGKVLDLSHIEGCKIDKHSTGGVGDKVSIALAPLVASCGVKVPMICGRGLGHTGGTLDKLEAIPGFRVSLSDEEFARIVGTVGTAIMGQTADIAPADKRMYALRDVTGTVESIPLIVASILSKKLAEGIDGLVLDVKVGQGAFMRDKANAKRLAKLLVSVGTHAKKKVVALLTNMNAPLGRTVGNALETREALELLFGNAPPDLWECTMALGVEMLLLGGAAATQKEARAKLEDAIRSGKAAAVMERLVEAQGGDPRVVADRSLLPSAPVVFDVPSPRQGYVVSIDAREVGLSAVALGAGRTRADQTVDPAVGFELLAKPGDRVRKGDPLFRVHARANADAIVDRVLKSFALAATRPKAEPLILERVTEKAPAKPTKRGAARAKKRGGRARTR